MFDRVLSRLIRSARPGLAREDGQTMAEYALILAGIAVVVAAVVWLLGDAISATLQSVIDQF